MARLALPLLLQGLGYTSGNPLGVRAALVVGAVFILIGLWVFQGYGLGDAPEETRADMSLPEA